MSHHSTLEKYEDNWQTSIGGLLADGQVLLRGSNIFTQHKNDRWMEFLLFGVTGKKDPELARLIEAIWIICTSYPDPRIWNNRVSALAGTTRSTGVLATAGSLAVTEANIYGSRAILGASDFLFRAEENLHKNMSLDEIVRAELKKFRSVYGFGRPILDEDERVQPMMDFANSRGFGKGKYIKLVFDVDDYFKKSRYNYRVNIAAVTGGLLADAGLSARNFYDMTTLAFSGGYMPCYADSLKKPEGALFPLRVSRINYTGCLSPRKWKFNF
jgi:citrate synthase